MISALILATTDEPAILDTLSALVAGVAEGVLRDAIIIGPHGALLDQAADAAGGLRLISSQSRAVMSIEAAKHAKAQWAFVVSAGLVPTGDWVRSLADFIEHEPKDREAGLIPVHARYGISAKVAAVRYNLSAVLLGRATASQGLLIRTQSLHTVPLPRLKLTRLEGAMIDRRTR
jgi:hypothetical protein